MSTSNYTTSVPTSRLTESGYVSPSEPNIRDGVKADLNAALGGNIGASNGTPQSQLANTMTAIIGRCNDVLLSLINGIDPRTASGRMQDAIGYIYFLTRNPNEGRADFEVRRANSVANNSVGQNGAILGKLLSLQGVNDAYVIDNPSNVPVTTRGVSLAPNSIYCCVSGGNPSDIALAIIQKKPPGCGFTGSNVVTIQDPAPVYNGNGPTYTVKYDPAVDTPIFFSVQIINAPSVPSSVEMLVKNAIKSAFQGNSNIPRPRIASSIIAGRYYSSVSNLGDWAQVEEITIGTAPNPTGIRVDLNLNQNPTLSDENISVKLV
ncbi:hypothetical protein [Swingsia samuiensis]|uniref:Baseplate protein J-like domain-containing protein n=1 Tax=Swingsia samuiensis TaxID=1293412 RepID=A0A4Y6UMY2_9PROT|nr:hypothetical protein [Swingsia samuiensis]QDH17395.1 hypothetical protein E3D00_07330 [Swingsia samuiensis]